MMRTLGYTVLGAIALCVLAVGGWVAWSAHQLRQFRLSEQARERMRTSQQGRRPLWRDPIEPRK